MKKLMALLGLGMIASSVSAFATQHIETECRAECWGIDSYDGAAVFRGMVRTWGVQDADSLIWDLQDQCPGYLVHSHLAGQTTTVTDSSSTTSSYYYSYRWYGYFYAGFQSTYATCTQTTTQMEFDSANSSNSCRAFDPDAPVHNIGGRPVGG